MTAAQLVSASGIYLFRTCQAQPAGLCASRSASTRCSQQPASQPAVSERGPQYPLADPRHAHQPPLHKQNSPQGRRTRISRTAPCRLRRTASRRPLLCMGSHTRTLACAPRCAFTLAATITPGSPGRKPEPARRIEVLYVEVETAA